MRILKACLIVVLVLVALMLAAFTLANWQRSVRETRSRADVAPKSGRFIRISDGEIYVQETGTASDTPILFVHGAGAWSELWRATLDQCPVQGQYCIAIDLPPFGFSETTAGAHYTRVDQSTRILEMMRHIRPGATFTVVGHSFGAGPTVEAVMRDASQVGALVVVDGALGIDAPQGSPGPITTLFSYRLVRNSLLSAFVTNPLFTKQLLLPLMYRKEAATESRVALLQQPLALEHGTNRLGDWSLDFLNSSVADSLSQSADSYSSMVVPTLILWGEQDTITPIAQGERLHQLLGQSQLVRFKDVGHMPQLEDVEAFNRALFNFVQHKK